MSTIPPDAPDDQVMSPDRFVTENERLADLLEQATRVMRLREARAADEADPSLEQVVKDFEDSITALASSFEPQETSPKTLGRIKKQIAQEKGGVVSRIRAWFNKS